ncbi:Rft protein-domain-containing protein [Piptocephalis cylindrospora]|uniref:Man(5)GlcNAc(2)-PP-dolichol translocation protein RFT1 n=1 Tax=Piptocephalis cylindrospora TaxID=1907219 RepID=A0A4P9Y3A6_9FUNG|nr:Rft protein-domain-containing protein [Piptocephalis cylindrospora]|eukprot:RKP13377.1 Rft protein-domain-containing protein [Piptocephalis cylindrospora]
MVKSSTDRIIQKSWKGARLLLLLQALSKLLTFTLNQVLYRLTSPTILGLAYVRFDLLLTTLLFLSREGLRCACLRQPLLPLPPRTREERKRVRLLVNTSYLPLLLILSGMAVYGGVVQTSTSAGWFRALGGPDQGISLPLALYLLAVLIELTAEPGYALIQATMDFSKDDTGQEGWMDGGRLGLAWTFTRQSLLKHFLTEGDRLVISTVSSVTDQGLYAFVGNYAPFYTHLLIRLLGGGDWVQNGAPSLLALYCAYIPFMGINGILEAFLQAVADSADLKKYSGAMVRFSIIYALAGFGCIQGLNMGAYGLVLANMLNMACRIDYCLRYARSFLSQGKEEVLQVGELIPHRALIGASLLGSGAVLASWEYVYLEGNAAVYGIMGHVAVGALVGATLLLTL